MRILIADDHYAVRQGLIQLVRDAFPDAELGEASDAPSLIRQCLSGDWSFVVTDLAMPGGGAMPAIKAIKEKKPGLPIVVVSTHSNTVYEDWTLKGGADYFLAKDSLSAQLGSLLKKLVAERGL